MISLARRIDNAIKPPACLGQWACLTLMDLAARLYIANVFFKSGKTRFSDLMNGSFENQITAFRDYHPVPGLDPELAAYGATFGEVTLPILLALGLFGRFAAGGLLVMSVVIYYALGEDAILLETYLWVFLTAALFVKGPGLFSVDHFLVKWLRKG